MPRFTYQARSRTGQKVAGVMLAENEEQLALTLSEMDLYLVNAKLDDSSVPFYITRPVKRRELINFTVHLSAAIGGGIPILQAFEDLELQTSNRRMKRAIGIITEDLRGGSSLSDALSRHSEIFSDIYVSMIRAGETSGSLVPVLQHLTSFLEWQGRLGAATRGAAKSPVPLSTRVA